MDTRNGLKALRTRKKLTQSAAAERMGMSRSGYVKVEDGMRRLGEHHIRLAMTVFDATEAEVLGTAPVFNPPGVVPPRDLKLTPEQARALAEACVMFLEETPDRRRETQWLEALVKIAKMHEGDPDDLLRVKVRTLVNLGG